MWQTPQATRRTSTSPAPRLGELDLLDRQRLPELLEHRGAHLHSRRRYHRRAERTERAAGPRRGPTRATARAGRRCPAGCCFGSGSGRRGSRSVSTRAISARSSAAISSLARWIPTQVCGPLPQPRFPPGARSRSKRSGSGKWRSSRLAAPKRSTSRAPPRSRAPANSASRPSSRVKPRIGEASRTASTTGGGNQLGVAAQALPGVGIFAQQPEHVGAGEDRRIERRGDEIDDHRARFITADLAPRRRRQRRSPPSSRARRASGSAAGRRRACENELGPALSPRRLSGPRMSKVSAAQRRRRSLETWIPTRSAITRTGRAAREVLGGVELAAIEQRPRRSSRPRRQGERRSARSPWRRGSPSAPCAGWHGSRRRWRGWSFGQGD